MTLSVQFVKHEFILSHDIVSESDIRDGRGGGECVAMSVDLTLCECNF